MNTPGADDKSGAPSGTSGALTIDRAAFLLLRVKRAFKKKKQQRKDKSAAAAAAAAAATAAAIKPEPLPRRPKPLLRSRTLPAIVVPGINILQAQIEARYRKDGTVSDSAVGSRTRGSSTLGGSVGASLGVITAHRHSSPEPPPGHVEAMLRLTPPPPNSLSRAYRVTAGSSTALYRLAKLLNATTSKSSGGVSPTSGGNATRRLSWERKDFNSSGLPRSSSIDSFVDICSQSSIVPGLGSPSSAASPGTIRRLKGPRAIQGE